MSREENVRRAMEVARRAVDNGDWDNATAVAFVVSVSNGETSEEDVARWEEASS